MSASSMPTFSPRSRKPSAKLTAVVDLPTPPFPEATAMTASTPGIPGCVLSAGWAARWAWTAVWAGCGPRAAEPGLRSAVNATSADCTPGIARTASSAALRTGSHLFTAAASTVSEKKTFPSETTTSESTRASDKAVPAGDGTLAKAARTCSLLTVMISRPSVAGHHRQGGGPVNAGDHRDRLTRPPMQ